MSELPAGLLRDLGALNLKIVAEYDAVERLPSGSLALDYALGGGWARSRINELFGNATHGKSTMAMICAAQTLATGGRTAYFDAEGTFDMEWAKKLSIPIESREQFCLVQAENVSGEGWLNGILAALKSNAFDLIVLDTQDALIYNAERGGKKKDEAENPYSVGDAQIGNRSRTFGDFCRKAADMVKQTRTCLLLLSQMRNQIGILYGSPERATGGKAKEFFTSTRVQLYTPSASIKEGDELVGREFHGKVIKNKTAVPEREFWVTVRQFIMEDGRVVYDVDYSAELVDIGDQLGVFTNDKGEKREKTQTPFFQDVGIGRWREGAVENLRANPDLRLRIESAIRGKMR